MIFHNPYHFVPVGPEPGVALSKADLERGDSEHVTHDRYVSEAGANAAFSGRLICRLTTEDPVFVGHQRAKDSRVVSPFELDGRPAIPATSLRGMLSAVAEAASNSALRVLEDRLLSRRMEIEEALPALGMIVKVTDENGNSSLRLRPLTLPPMRFDKRTNEGRLEPAQAAYAHIFRRMPATIESHVPLKFFVNGYEKDSSVTPPVLRAHPRSFLDRMKPDSYAAGKATLWYIKAGQPPSWVDNNTRSRVSVPRPQVGGGGRLLGQQADDERPISETEYARRGKPAGYVRGILRVLGIGRTANMPTERKYEIFIPYPEGIEAAPTYEIEAARLKFEELADQRTREERKQLLPFELTGSCRNDDAKQFGRKLRLRDGDLVFFRAEGGEVDWVEAPVAGGAARGLGNVPRISRREGAAAPPTPQPAPDVKITDIAVSSIWRSEAGGTVHQFFSGISKEFLPFHPEREIVTPAEALFGFVEQRKKGEQRRDEALALAGRLRFSFGLLGPAEGGAHYLPPVSLKALLSPKPPSPALYFKKRAGQGYIAKRGLNLADDVPQGRKFYLHGDARPGPDSQPWKSRLGETDGDSMRSVVTPIVPGRRFFFHIDFDNLSRQELGLLCYAVRPSESFRHKLGMGKPIGLGGVCLDPIGILFVDRSIRYRRGSFAVGGDRYHGLTRGSGMPGRLDDLARDEKEGQRTLAALRALYPREASEWDGLSASTRTWPTFDELRAACAVDRDAARALELLGDPAQVQAPVHTPQVIGADGAAMEEKSYEWFMANDQTGRQFLEPLTRDSQRLPTLRRLPRPKAKR